MLHGVFVYHIGSAYAVPACFITKGCEISFKTAKALFFPSKIASGDSVKRIAQDKTCVHHQIQLVAESWQTSQNGFSLLSFRFIFFCCIYGHDYHQHYVYQWDQKRCRTCFSLCLCPSDRCPVMQF